MTDVEDILDERRFTVTSIEKTEAPEGMPAGNWYQYTIGKGESVITGKRPGSLESVKQHAMEFAENLKLKATLGYSAYAARKQQK